MKCVQKCLCFFVLFVLQLVCAEINIIVNSGISSNETTIAYSGNDVKLVTDHETALFGIKGTKALKDAVTTLYEERPTNVYLNSPTPWGDLYKKYKWEPVKRILKVKSATIKDITYRTVMVHSQDFENNFNNTIKVNTGISHTVENTVTTRWESNKEIAISQEVEYKLDVLFAKLSGVTGFSYTSFWGESEEKSETVTLGSSSAVETELKPGQSCSAILTANKGYLDIEIVYLAYLKGNVAVNFKQGFKGHHFWGPSIDKVLKSAGKSNEKTATEVIRVGFYSDASLKVYDKVSGRPM